MHYYRYYPSPIGQMLIVANDDGVSGLYFVDQKYYRSVRADWREDAAQEHVARCARELDEYYAGARTEFGFAMAPEGTAFQRAVWKAISSVPYGETISYAQLARRAGGGANPRAAATATGRNPISIAVPCHRIVGSNGSLTGYAGGLDKKRALLALESREPSLL